MYAARSPTFGASNEPWPTWPASAWAARCPTAPSSTRCSMLGRDGAAPRRVPRDDRARRFRARHASSSPRLAPAAGHERDHLERFLGAVGGAFFEIAFDPTHLVRDMGKAQHRLGARPGEGIERGRLHLDGEDAGILGR